MIAVAADAAVRVRPLIPGDLEHVVRIDALHTAERKPAYWQRVFSNFLDAEDGQPRVGLAAEADSQVVGYLLGEVRAFEFGSEACGWIFGVGVAPDGLRRRVASRLLAECCRRFRALGIRQVRTMVRRDNVPVLSFFRANGFVAGRFTQLELELDEEERE